MRPIKYIVALNKWIKYILITILYWSFNNITIPIKYTIVLTNQ